VGTSGGKKRSLTPFFPLDNISFQLIRSFDIGMAAPRLDFPELLSPELYQRGIEVNEVNALAGWRRLLACGVCDVPKGQVCAARPVQWIHAEHGHVMQAVNTASLTTANPQANSRGRA